MWMPSCRNARTKPRRPSQSASHPRKETDIIYPWPGQAEDGDEAENGQRGPQEGQSMNGLGKLLQD